MSECSVCAPQRDSSSPATLGKLLKCFLKLSPLVEQGQQLPSVIQVIARHAAEAERVQVAKGDRGKRHDRGRDLVHFGDVWVLQVELDPVHAHEQ